MPRQDFYDDVMYAMRIRTLQGYMISWMGYPFKKNEFLNIQQDTMLEVEYILDCNFSKGVFCIDAGLQSVVNNELFFHVSINNVYTFKIDENLKTNLNGDAYLNYRAV